MAPVTAAGRQSNFAQFSLTVATISGNLPGDGAFATFGP